MLKPLLTHNFLFYRHHSATFAILEIKNPTDAFKLMEVELGFLYDALYTKTTRICFSLIILRFISFLSFCSALASFFLATNRHAYSKIDITVSYIFLVGAVFLEIYAVIMLLFSDWSMLSLSMPNKPIANFFHRVIFPSRLQLFFRNQKRWSESMAQKNIITDFVEKELANKNCVRKLLGIGRIERLEKVGTDLKQHVFNQILQKRSRYNPTSGIYLNDLRKLLAERGEGVLQRHGCLGDLRQTVVDLDFHSSLLTWHIATTLCFYTESQRNGNTDPNDVHQYRKRGKSISDYMLYLLIDSSLLLPEGNGEQLYENVKQEITGIGGTVMTCTSWDVCKFLRGRSDTSLSSIERSPLTIGCSVAQSLDSLETEPGWSNERKWKMISEVWVEMLTYAAVQGQWKEHAQTLTRGGELLTFVRLLMAHLGLIEKCVGRVGGSIY